MILEVVSAAEKFLLLKLIPGKDLVTGDAGDNAAALLPIPRARGISLSIQRWNIGSLVPRRFAVFTATL
jgi:hypothetical protein